jgi:hypothetical protein
MCFRTKENSKQYRSKTGEINDEGRYSKLPAKLWSSIVDEILHKYLKNLKSIKIPTFKDITI